MPGLYPTVPTAPPLDDAPPPSYERASDADAMPPSYESLFGEFQQVDSPRGLAHFLQRAGDAIMNTLTAMVVVALLNIVPIGMIIIGSINIKNCRLQPMIPKWLVVSGCCYLVKAALSYWKKIRIRQGERRELPCLIMLFGWLLNVFLAIWFILGTFWVYMNYSEHSRDSTADDYCDEFTYVFSFVFITLTYILLILSCVAFCCCCGFVCCRGAREQQSSP